MDIQPIVLFLLLLFFVFIILMNFDFMKRGQSVDQRIMFLYGNHREGMKSKSEKEGLDDSSSTDLVTTLFNLQTTIKGAKMTVKQIAKLNTDLSGTLLNMNSGLVSVVNDNLLSYDYMNLMLSKLLVQGPNSSISTTKTAKSIVDSIQNDAKTITDYVNNLPPATTPTLNADGTVTANVDKKAE
jgi:hypothetical protein